jgi:hypothetical protein
MLFRRLQLHSIQLILPLACLLSTGPSWSFSYTPLWPAESYRATAESTVAPHIQSAQVYQCTHNGEQSGGNWLWHNCSPDHPTWWTIQESSHCSFLLTTPHTSVPHLLSQLDQGHFTPFRIHTTTAWSAIQLIQASWSSSSWPRTSDLHSNHHPDPERIQAW